jgi:hypothetical protein
MVFSSGSEPFRDVMVAGDWVVQNGTVETEAADRERFATMMRSLHS